MLIRIGFDLTFQNPAPVATLLMLYTHPTRAADLVMPEKICTDPAVPISQYTDIFGNRCGRTVAPAGLFRIWHSTIVRDTGSHDVINPAARQLEVAELPQETLQFLLPSRYCETDRLSEIAWGLFGHTQPGWSRVQAIFDWVHNNVKFGYQFARPTKTAYDVYTERQGVCRDFTHLSISLCRCLNIPARYATGYLGDIGVPFNPSPMDFSAWSEIFLEGRWYTFDARHNIPRIGRIVMARGRDAADVALTTSFGPSNLQKFQVITEEVSEAFMQPGTLGCAQMAVA
jgi:transglutaminase-like putative cysteine protease